MMDHPAMQPFTDLIIQAESLMLESLPSTWRGLKELLLDQQSAGFHHPYLLLTLASTAAIGGKAEYAVPTAAAVATAAIGNQIQADLMGMAQEKPAEQVAQLAAMAQALPMIAMDILRCSNLTPEILIRVQSGFLQSNLMFQEGSYFSINPRYEKVQDYWKDIAMTDGSSYAMATMAGALTVTGDGVLVRLVTGFGNHLGMMSRFLRELQAWESTGTRPMALANGSLLLPMLFGLDLEHDGQAELKSMWEAGINANNAPQAVALLEKCEPEVFIQAIMLKEAQKALLSLKTLQGSEGKAALEACITSQVSIAQ